MAIKNTIQVFEHKVLYIDEVYNVVKFEKHHYIALSKLNVLHNDKYFEVRHNGIKFKHYVGVIQVEGLTIEILPKIHYDDKDEGIWHNALVDMLRVTRKLKVQKVNEADVNKQQIHLLDIYFEWFLNEVQILLHQGLIKQYYKETGNVKALKGKLEFAGHISKNLVHKERFYTSHQVYDKDHLVHQVLFKALDIVEKCTKGNYLYSKCKTVQLDFPEVKNINVSEATFSKFPKNRKTAPYETALAIARLIILNYAPNVSSGNERMLALLFDMNSLWEEYILVRLKQSAGAGMKIYGQNSKAFWSSISIRPDIVLEKGDERIVIDTKWKNIDTSNPSTNDLRQMYVYNDYWNAGKAMLLYPSKTNAIVNFKAFEPITFHAYNGENAVAYNRSQHECGVGRISIFKEGTDVLDEGIGDKILEWLF